MGNTQKKETEQSGWATGACFTTLSFVAYIVAIFVIGVLALTTSDVCRSDSTETPYGTQQTEPTEASDTAITLLWIAFACNLIGLALLLNPTLRICSETCRKQVEQDAAQKFRFASGFVALIGSILCFFTMATPNCILIAFVPLLIDFSIAFVLCLFHVVCCIIDIFWLICLFFLSIFLWFFSFTFIFFHYLGLGFSFFLCPLYCCTIINHAYQYYF